MVGREVPARAGVPLSRAVLATLSVTFALAGCYHGTAQTASPRELGREPGWVMVEGILWKSQTADKDCGAAALAMMLQYWSVPASVGEIWRTASVEPGHGIAAGALRDFAQKKGLRAFLIKGELDDLVNEVGLHRPVLVGLVQRYGDRQLSHYEVVAGINRAARRVYLLDPARGPREDGFDGFFAEWDAAGRPALVIVPS